MTLIGVYLTDSLRMAYVYLDIFLNIRLNISEQADIMNAFDQECRVPRGFAGIDVWRCWRLPGCYSAMSCGSEGNLRRLPSSARENENQTRRNKR